MRPSKWASSLAHPAIILLACLGCGGAEDEYPRVPISGTITLDGRPLPGGIITFEPRAGQPTQSGGMIAEGTFSVPREEGPVPGPYSVSIFAGSPDPGLSTNGGQAEPPARGTERSRLSDPVPTRYNINTTLTADVKAGDENHFRFDLESK